MFLFAKIKSTPQYRYCGSYFGKAEGWLLLWQTNRHDSGRTPSKAGTLWCTDRMPYRQRLLVRPGHQAIPKL